MFQLFFLQHFRLEALNEKRTSVVQMVKLAEKEREGLEVRLTIIFDAFYCFLFLDVIKEFSQFYYSFDQGVKNEAEEYMLKELSLLKWQEKATRLASENNITEIADIQAAISSLEENVKSER